MKIEYVYRERAIVRFTCIADVPDDVLAAGEKAAWDYLRTTGPHNNEQVIDEWLGAVDGSFKILPGFGMIIDAARDALAFLEAAASAGDLEDMDKGVRIAWEAAKAIKQRREDGKRLPDHIEMLSLATETINRLHEAEPDNTGIAVLGAGMLKAALACVPE